MTQKTSLCTTCQNPDGTPNTDLMDNEGTCTFGCNRKVDTDYGICPECKDHSQNVFECEVCNRVYEQGFGSDGKWNEQNG